MTPWHAPPDTLERYATGDIDDITACSIEAHLERCAECRRVLARAADPVLGDAMWDGVVDRVDRPRPHVIERMLGRVGFDEASARLVSATPALRAAWLAAVALVVGVVVVACQLADSDALFLAIAPLLPLAGVAAVFAPGTEPAGEVGSATPVMGFGLVVRRAELVLATSFAILLIGAVALPGLEPRDATWVLPALALSLTTMAIAGRAPVLPTAIVLGGGWLTGLCLLKVLAGPGVDLSDAVVFTAVGQIALGLVAVAALGALLTRGDLDPIDPGA